MVGNVSFAFHVLGSPRLEVDGVPVTLAPQPAVFCSFLVLNRHRRVTREEVQAAFWPDAPPTKAQERLRRTLYLLRRAMEPHSTFVATEGTELAIAPDVSLWVDYEAFEAALLKARRSDPPRREALEQAVALYVDDLLKDVYADWALLEREHARQQFLVALRDLVEVCLHQQDWAAAVHFAHVALHHDPYQETAHRALMMAHAAAGDRGAALRQYRQCQQLLWEELGVEPMPETQELAEKIRHGTADILAPRVNESASIKSTQSVALDPRNLPLVGRKAELAAIAAEWEICREGHSRLVLVTGSAGMGKSRLVQEAASTLPGHGVQVLTGNCYAMEAGTPYQLVADVMKQAVDYMGEQLSARLHSDLEPLIPHFVSGEQAGEDRRAEVHLDASVRIQNAVTEVLCYLAQAHGGVWLVAEDLHWADPASLACLNHALRACRDLPLMVIATLRDEEVSFDSPLMDWPTNSLHAPAPTTLIRLSPLPPDQLDDLLGTLSLGDDAKIAEYLHRETAGNPLFVVETLRMLIDQGILFQTEDGTWQLQSDAMTRLVTLPLPDIVLRVIQGRIRRLSRAAQEVLAVAAVMEHDIDEDVLAEVIDPAVVLDLALDEVLRAAILEEIRSGIYQFTHIKVREVLYADMSAPRRRFLHRRLAGALARRRVLRLADVSNLAYHYMQARAWTPALAYGWQAAQMAFQAGALAEANRYAVIALEILQQHADDIDSEVLPETLPALEFDLVMLRVEFHRLTSSAGGYYPPDLVNAIERLLPEMDLARQAQGQLVQSTHWLGQGRLAEARAAAETGRKLYANLGDQQGELQAILHEIDVAFLTGDMVTVRRLLGEFNTANEVTDDRRLAPVALNNAMRLAIYDGDWLRLLRTSLGALSMLQPLEPAVAWMPLAHLSLAYMKLGASEAAHEAAQRAVKACEDAEVFGLGAQMMLARLRYGSQDIDGAISVLRHILEPSGPGPGPSATVGATLLLIRCYLRAGDLDEATKWAEHLGRVVTQIRLPILYALGQLGWALVHAVAGRYDKAARRLRPPLEYLSLTEDTSPQEICALRAVVAQALGEKQEAREWIEAAVEAATRQADLITDSAYRRSFWDNVQLHTWLMQVHHAPHWKTENALPLF